MVEHKGKPSSSRLLFRKELNAVLVEEESLFCEPDGSAIQAAEAVTGPSGNR